MKRFTLLVAFLLSTLTADLMAQSEEDIAPFPLGPIGGTAYQKTGSSLLRVTEITAGGPGAAAGLRVGDFIYGANNERLPAMGPVHVDGWRGAVSELGYAIERSENSGGALTLQILRPDSGNLSLNLTLPQKTAWRPSYPVGDLRMEAFFDKVCEEIHRKITASPDGNFGYDTGFMGLILLAHRDWNTVGPPRPYRQSITKIKDHCLTYLQGLLTAPQESPLDCGPGQGTLGIGLENWELMTSAMFLGEYRRKTTDTSVNAAVQRAAEMIANRIQSYSQLDNAGVSHEKLGRMGHCGVVGDYPHASLSCLNIMNAHAMVAMGILKGAGANFGLASGTSGLTIDQKYQLSWTWLKSCTNTSGDNADGNIGYGGIQTGDFDSAARTSGTAAGYEIYRAAGGTSATADDLDKLNRMKAYTPRNWPRQQHAHAYTTGGVAFTQMLMPFTGVREQRYFMENSRFFHTLTRSSTGDVLYFPGRALSDSDNQDLSRFVRPGLAWAIASGSLPSFPLPAGAASRAYVRMNSPRNDWPQLAARRVKVAGLVQNLDLDVTNAQGTPLTTGYTAAWSRVSGAGVVFFSAPSALDTAVTFSAAGNYRLRLVAMVGSTSVTEDYDFDVASTTSPVDTTASVTQQPISRYATPGGNVSFSLAVAGTGPFLYQWKRNGVNFGDPQLTPTLSLTNLSVDAAGAYQCTILHPGGQIVSNEAVLSIPGIWTIVPGALKRQVWNNLSGTDIAGLTGSVRYPFCPDLTGTVTSAEVPRTYGDNYGQKLSGWITPPVTGTYQFYLASDDASEVWLSTSDSAAGLAKIVSIASATGYRNYGASSQNFSLVAGKRYYLEALHKEGGGDDYLTIAWLKPGETLAVPIPSSALEYASFTPDSAAGGLVSWWKFDEASGVLAMDSTPTANDGNIVDATPIAGKSGGARFFDGSARIACSNAGAICGLSPFTAMAWVKVNAGNARDGVILQQRAANGYDGQYQLVVNAAGTVRFYCFGDLNQQFSFSGTHVINDGQWHHVAASRDAAGAASIYVDGALSGSVTGTTVRNLDGGIAIGIGADIRDNNTNFRGSIDEVRIYNRALSQPETTTLMNTTTTAVPRSYQQAFTGLANGATTFTDGSVLTTDNPGAARINGVSNPSLIMTAAETLFTRTQYVLPQLNPATYGFIASFRYALIKPLSGPWADGFGFYLKPAAEPVDTASNQIGGYARGLGVEFITFSNPRHQIRVNNLVLPVNYPVSPAVNGIYQSVVIDYRKPPGLPGSLSLFLNGVAVLRDVPVNYTTGPSDVFALTARTGGFAETTLIDDIVITPLTLKPASGISTRILNQQGSLLITEVKWDTETGGLYDVFSSTDLTNWTFERTYTATGPTQAITSVSQPSTKPHLFYRVSRQQ